MSKFSLRGALSMKASEAEPGTPFPISMVKFMIAKVDLPATSSAWEQAVFFCRPVEMLEVDEDDLKQWAEETGKNPSEFEFRHAFLFNTEDAADSANTLAVMTLFLSEHCEAGSEDETIETLLTNAKGCEFLAEVKHRPNKRLGAGIMEAYIASTAPASDD